MRAAAAARLGLFLAAASASEKIGSRAFMRRSSSNLAEAGIWKKKGMMSGSGSELDKEKSLYICFFEMSRGVDGAHWMNHIVRPIRLNSDDDGKEEEVYLSEAALKRCGGFRDYRFSGRFGSQILLPSLSEGYIDRVDTSTRPIKFEDSSIEFSNPKLDPVLGKLNGKLYCIEFSNPGTLEVLDLKDDEFNWRPLDNVPFPDTIEEWGPRHASILEGSNKILAWQMGIAEAYCYDPENGYWTESSFQLANTVPFLGYFGRRSPPIFIHNHHPDLGDFYLILDYYPYHGPLRISSLFMSRDCVSVKTIQNEPIQLPEEVLSNFIPGTDLEMPISTDYWLVYLGDQKVCLVWNVFSDDEKRGTIQLITFEYDIIPNGFEVNIRTRFLSTRHFRYHSEHLHDREIRTLDITGAFVL